MSRGWTDAYLERMAARFKALGEPARLRIIESLRRDGEQTVTELVDGTRLGQANLSKHLQVLHGAGLVVRRRDGLYVRYAIADDEIGTLCDVMCGRLEREFHDDRRDAHTSA